MSSAHLLYFESHVAGIKCLPCSLQLSVSRTWNGNVLQWKKLHCLPEWLTIVRKKTTANLYQRCKQQMTYPTKYSVFFLSHLPWLEIHILHYLAWSTLTKKWKQFFSLSWINIILLMGNPFYRKRLTYDKGTISGEDIHYDTHQNFSSTVNNSMGEIWHQQFNSIFSQSIKVTKTPLNLKLRGLSCFYKWWRHPRHHETKQASLNPLSKALEQL